MKRYKIFTSLSTVSNNEITIESNQEMATAYWLVVSGYEAVVKKPQPINNVIVSLVLR